MKIGRWICFGAAVVVYICSPLLAGNENPKENKEIINETFPDSISDECDCWIPEEISDSLDKILYNEFLPDIVGR